MTEDLITDETPTKEDALRCKQIRQYVQERFPVDPSTSGGERPEWLIRMRDRSRYNPLSERE